VLKPLRWIGLFTMAAAAVIFLFAARRTVPLPDFGRAPTFSLLDQDGGTLRDTEMEGTVWLASFVFTSCPDVCPLITARMAEIRDSLADRRMLGQQVRLVSVTVDPERDTPGVLLAYAGRFGGSPPGEWAFLTGPPAIVRATVEQGFHISATPIYASPTRVASGPGGMHDDPHEDSHDEHGHGPTHGEAGSEAAHADAAGGDAAAGYDVIHSDHLLLFDGEGRLRAIHTASDPELIGAVLRDIRALARR